MKMGTLTVSLQVPNNPALRLQVGRQAGTSSQMPK